jgi:competence protein ComEC
MVRVFNNVSQFIGFVKPIFTKVVVVFLVIVGGSWLIIYKKELLSIYFLDVGQGDSVFVETFDNYSLLIDTGEDLKVVEQLDKILPLGSRKIDVVVLTHSHADHIGGILGVLERYEVGKIMYNEADLDSSTWSGAREYIDLNNVLVEPIHDLDDFWLGCCVFVDVLWPVMGEDIDSNANNNSVALLLQYGEFDMFLAGDLESKIEDRVVSSYSQEVDVLKVSHHGSNTSTSALVLDILYPKIAVISVGKDNKYKHPSSEVLARLEEQGALVFLTSAHGSIHIATDGYVLYY